MSILETMRPPRREVHCLSEFLPGQTATVFHIRRRMRGLTIHQSVWQCRALPTDGLPGVIARAFASCLNRGRYVRTAAGATVWSPLRNRGHRFGQCRRRFLLSTQRRGRSLWLGFGILFRDTEGLWWRVPLRGFQPRRTVEYGIRLDVGRRLFHTRLVIRH